jgi:hypothetical protein
MLSAGKASIIHFVLGILSFSCTVADEPPLPAKAFASLAETPVRASHQASCLEHKDTINLPVALRLSNTLFEVFRVLSAIAKVYVATGI